VTILVNAGGSRAYGLDADVSYRFPGDRFNIHANFEYLHARYTNFKNASNLTVDTKGTPSVADDRFTSVIGDWTGRRVIRAPDFSGSVTADYTVPLLGGKLMASATASFSSRYAPTNASYQCPITVAVPINVCTAGSSHKGKGLFEENGYILVNGRISWTDPSDHYTITGFVDNLTNERYLFLARASGNGGDYKLTAPRAAGIQLGVKF
jgi:iron complex outermembrane receptor protein